MELAKYQVGICLFFCLLLAGNKASAQFSSHVNGVQNGSTFTYTVFNDESISSSLYATTFSLTTNAPFTVISSPAGWAYETDNVSQIDWYNTDPSLPYPHDVAPGSSLSGFVIQSDITTTQLLGDGVTSWDHSSDSGGSTYTGYVIAPSITGMPVPEASTGTSLGFGLITAGFGIGLKARKRKNTTESES